MGYLDEHPEHVGRVLLNVRATRLVAGRPTRSVAEDAQSTGVDYWSGWHEDWTVLKSVPREPTWAKSEHASATKIHRIRFCLTATHASGHVERLIVWSCSARCYSGVRIYPAPTRRPNADVCWNCQRTEGVPDA